MYTELQTIIAKQRQFITAASHELRTPLTTVSSCVELVSSFPEMPGADRTSVLADAVHESRRMAALLDDLLILASTDAGEQLRKHSFSWAELLEPLVRDARLRCAPRSVIVDLPDDLGGGEGDVKALRRVVNNLFDNVAVHTPSTATMTFSGRGSDDAVELRLCDTGGGVADADHERIFERFVRLDPARTGAHAGLGLAIASTVVTAHGGHIGARANPVGGLCVELRLPRRLSGQPGMP